MYTHRVMKVSGLTGFSLDLFKETLYVQTDKFIKFYLIFIDGTETADRKRQRLNSEQDESQSTSNDNENEQRDDTTTQSWAPRRRLLRERIDRDTRTPPAESESSATESNEPATEPTSKFNLKCIF